MFYFGYTQLILRIAAEDDVSYTVAKSLLHKKLKKVEAIVFPGACFILEYQEIFPDKIVTAIPLGFINQGIHVNLSKRMTQDAVVCIGSNTTWGEMRYIDDLVELLKSINNHD